MTIDMFQALVTFNLQLKGWLFYSRQGLRTGMNLVYAFWNARQSEPQAVVGATSIWGCFSL